MSYTPTNWKNGDVVTSAKLNKLEKAVGIYYFHAEYSGTTFTSQQTIADLEEAYAAGRDIMLEVYDDNEGFTVKGFMNREEYDGEIYYTGEAFKYSSADEVLFIIGVAFSTESGLSGEEVVCPLTPSNS